MSTESGLFNMKISEQTLKQLLPTSILTIVLLGSLAFFSTLLHINFKNIGATIKKYKQELALTLLSNTTNGHTSNVMLIAQYDSRNDPRYRQDLYDPYDDSYDRDPNDFYGRRQYQSVLPFDTTLPSFQGAVYGSGTVFHSVFGLTLRLPQSWRGYRVVQSREIYAGIPSTATYTFYIQDEPTLTINVFNKEQWNDIRIQDNLDLIDFGSLSNYYGEGAYRGENITYIFSYEIHDRESEARAVISGAQFF